MRWLSLPNFCLKVSKIHFTQGVSPISVKIEMKNLFQLLFGGGGGDWEGWAHWRKTGTSQSGNNSSEKVSDGQTDKYINSGMQGSRNVTVLHRLSDWYRGQGCCTSFPMPLSTSGPLTCCIVPSTHRQVTLPKQPVAFLDGETVSPKTLHPQLYFSLFPFWTCPSHHTTKSRIPGTGPE